MSTTPISWRSVTAQTQIQRATMAPTEKLAPSLLGKAAKAPVDAIVFFEQPDSTRGRNAVSKLELASRMQRGPARKTAAMSAIREISDASLETRQAVIDGLVSGGKIASVDKLWAFNAVRIRGASPEALKALRATGVKEIMEDVAIVPPMMPDAYTDPIKGAAKVTRPRPGLTRDDSVWIDWGVDKMKSSAAWEQGITGAGIVIGSLDTGVLTSHPGLAHQYRGQKADGTQDHAYNYYNALEKDNQVPFDDVGHGTHTIGSALGNDSGNLVGVAPDAKFVAVRALGEKGGSLFSLLAGMEWMMAPTDQNGQNPKPELAPDIVTNSWGGAPVSNAILWTALRNWDRAGVIPIFASGNDRNPKPGQVSAPGMYPEAITVGATEHSDKRAFFSMYGPSPHSKLPKPDVMAPGVMTYSTLPDGSFRDTFIIDGKPYAASGTSMATPHVAGAAALFLQAHPNSTTEQIRQALMGSGLLADAPTAEMGSGRVQVDKLIAAGSFDASKVVLTDPARVQELMSQVKRGKVFNPEGKMPPKPTAEPVAA